MSKANSAIVGKIEARSRLFRGMESKKHRIATAQFHVLQRKFRDARLKQRELKLLAKYVRYAEPVDWDGSLVRYFWKRGVSKQPHVNQLLTAVCLALQLLVEAHECPVFDPEVLEEVFELIGCYDTSPVCQPMNKMVIQVECGEYTGTVVKTPLIGQPHFFEGKGTLCLNGEVEVRGYFIENVAVGTIATPDSTVYYTGRIALRRRPLPYRMTIVECQGFGTVCLSQPPLSFKPNRCDAMLRTVERSLVLMGGRHTLQANEDYDVVQFALFIGNWSNNLADGPGVATFACGGTCTGVWNKGKLVSGVYSNGCCHSNGVIVVSNVPGVMSKKLLAHNKFSRFLEHVDSWLPDFN